MMGQDNWLMKPGEICVLTVLQPEVSTKMVEGWFSAGLLLWRVDPLSLWASYVLSSACIQLGPHHLF